MSDSSGGNQFFGKYRGKVTDIEDPLMMGRIKANVPDVTGDGDIGWALPCAPFGGNGMGFCALPTVGAGVWIEFEHGDPNYPIWAGTWWGASSELPSSVLSPPYKKVLLQTDGGHKITMDDTPGDGGITFETSDGMKIEMTSQGIVIDNGNGSTITLTGPKIDIKGTQVSINDGALQIV